MINDFLAGILTSIGDGVIVTDMAANIVFMNAAAEKITGWETAAAVREDFAAVFRLFDADSGGRAAYPTLGDLAEGGVVGLKDGTMLAARDGGRKYLSASFSLVKYKEESLGMVVIFRDVTQFKLLEKKHADGEANLRTMFDSAPVGMLSLDEQARIEQINYAALSMLGGTKREALGSAFGDVFRCLGSEAVGCGFGPLCENCELRRSIRLAFEGLATSGLECCKTFTKAGREKMIWFRASAAPHKVDGKLRVLVSLVDITDSKHKEFAITSARDFYLRIFENFPAIIWRSNLDGRNEYTNANWFLLTGQTEEQAQGHGWLERIHPDDRAAQQALPNSEGDLRETELRVLSRSGEYRWLYSVMKMYCDMDGNPEGYLGMAIDITDRKNAEEGLSRYKVLSELAKDIIWFADTDGNILEANAAAVGTYGYTREELLSRTVFDIRHAPREQPDIVKHLQRADNEGVFFETVHYRKDGTAFPVEVSSQGTHIGGRRVLLSIIRDISERKAGEEKLRRAKEEAEAAYKAKSEFLANMSHEIRTPLNGIVGMVDLTLMSDLKAEQRDNLTTAKSCAGSLVRIINDILDFSKLEAGKIVLENRVFEVRQLLEDIINASTPAAARKGLQLNLQFSAAVPRYVLGDETRLRQVLWNLIDNGVKFTEAGSVTLQATAEPRGKTALLTFAVRDTGIGIAAEDMDKLFKTFSQVDGSITRRFGGTGLGLAISKHLAERMGGRLWVESQKGEGSCFNFAVTLEIADSPALPAREKEPEYRARVPKGILLVEDDLISRTLTARMLSRMGHTVTEAGDGLEALTLLKGQAFDAILMDIQMPRLDGVETTRRIRNAEATAVRRVPIVAVTAHALSGDRERFLAAGMDEYIAKPIQFVALFNLIEKLSPQRPDGDKPPIQGLTINEAGELVTAKPKMVSLIEEAAVFDKIAGLLGQVTAAAVGNDAGMLEGLAQRIRDLAGEVEAEELKNTAFKVQLAARRNDPAGAMTHLATIGQMLETYRRSRIIS